MEILYMGPKDRAKSIKIRWRFEPRKGRYPTSGNPRGPGGNWPRLAAVPGS